MYCIGLQFVLQELLEAGGETGEVELHFLFGHFVSLEEVVPRLFDMHLAGHPTLRVPFLEPLQLGLPSLLQLLFLTHPKLTYLTC